MRNKFTEEEFFQIDELVQSAITAHSKAAAKEYIDQLRYIGIDVCGYSRTIYSELIAMVSTASGNVSEKQHWLDCTKPALYKVEAFGVDHTHN